MTQVTLSEALELAVQEHKANRLDRAEQVYRKILNVQPEQPDALHGLGILAWQTGKYGLAENLIRGALKVQPNAPRTWCDLGAILQKKSNFSEAAIAYQKALEIEPNQSAVQNKLGYTLQQIEEFDRASECFKKAMELKHSSVEVLKHSPYENIYHCCVQKTASQWFRSIFNDRLFYQYTGLVTFPYTQAGLKDARFNRALPTQTIATHVYISYPTYLTIPKPEKYKTFFIARDPRDIVVSFYFSTKYSHSLVAYIPKMRKDLEQLSLKDGLKYSIDRLEDMGLFAALQSWLKRADTEEKNIKVFHYEDLASDNKAFLKNMLDFLEIDMPEEGFSQLYDRHQFKRYTQGRDRGEEDINSHYRKGESGDWKNYFDESILAYFKQVTKDSIGRLVYPES